MSDNELSCEYLRHQYIDLNKTRYEISAETGVSPIRIGALLQKFGIRRRHVVRHGLSSHPLNVMWCGLKERCGNPLADNYKWYGGAGICVCEEWTEFLPFYKWAIDHNWAPGMSIDRIDGTKGYYPENCRFITHKEQCRNRRTNISITVNGETHLQCEWEEIFGLHRGAIAKWKRRHDMAYVEKRLKEMMQ